MATGNSVETMEVWAEALRGLKAGSRVVVQDMGTVTIEEITPMWVGGNAYHGKDSYGRNVTFERCHIRRVLR